jgi:PAS domain S-box-containing protein
VVQTGNFTRTLTHRYVLALVLLTTRATIALFSVDRVISAQEGTAALINASGRQRMLSQRVVLFASRLTLEGASEREEARRELAYAIESLARTHAALSSGRGGDLGLPAEMSPGLHRIYFGGADAVDSLMSSFVPAARALADKAAAGPVAADDPDLALLNTLGPTLLLRALDAAVAHYEADGEAAIRDLRILEIVIWLAGLLVLLASALLIFAPMVRRLQINLAETRAAASALAESEERFALAAQGASVGIRDHCDLRLDVEYWSPQLYHVLGYAPGELAARASSFNKLVHPSDRQRVHDALERHLEERTPLQFECRLRHKTHGYRWFLCTGQATWTADGLPRRLITSFKDIDERVQVEQMKSEFVSTVSHELRTPLTSIMGAIGLLRSKFVGPLSPKAEQLVSVAFDNSERLVHLINDILDVEKMEAGKVAFDFKPESLAQLLEHAKEQNALFAEQHGASIVVAPMEHDITLEVDEARFAQVMANFLSNAAKYSPPGGQITIATQLLDGAVRISVSDQGPGIPEDFRRRIFERFAQADASNAKNKGGTGLGLNIAKAIVEAHKGTIGFDTTDGQGTTFYFELPTAQSGAAPPPAKGEFPDILGIPTGKIERARSARILIVEPEAAVRSTISRLVGDVAELTTAATCREAGPLLARRAFDLLVLDRALLDEEGHVILPFLSDKNRPAPPVLLYGAGGEDPTVWPAGLATHVKAEVDEHTLRQAVLDELRSREEVLATRFKKSA